MELPVCVTLINTKYGAFQCHRLVMRKGSRPQAGYRGDEREKLRSQSFFQLHQHQENATTQPRARRMALSQEPHMRCDYSGNEVISLDRYRPRYDRGKVDCW